MPSAAKAQGVSKAGASKTTIKSSANSSSASSSSMVRKMPPVLPESSVGKTSTAAGSSDAKTENSESKRRMEQTSERLLDDDTPLLELRGAEATQSAAQAPVKAEVENARPTESTSSVPQKKPDALAPAHGEDAAKGALEDKEEIAKRIEKELPKLFQPIFPPQDQLMPLNPTKPYVPMGIMIV